MVAEYVAVPKSIIDRNKMVTLAADVFFVDGTGFLMTESRNIKFSWWNMSQLVLLKI